MKKKKKSKILIFCSSVLTLLLCAFIFSVKTKADVNSNIVPDYGEYQYLIWVGPSSRNDHDYTAYLIANINNNNLSYAEEFDIDMYYIEYDNTGTMSTGLYLINASIIEPEHYADYYYAQFWIDQFLPYQTFISQYSTYSYNLGYQWGSSASQPEIYEQGYNYGYSQGYDIGINISQSDSYTSGYNEGYEVGYNSGVNAQMPNVQLSILSLLGTIFMFPFKLIALGFDVEIFGVNVGELMIFILWTSLILGIVAVLKKGVIK